MPFIHSTLVALSVHADVYMLTCKITCKAMSPHDHIGAVQPVRLEGPWIFRERERERERERGSFTLEYSCGSHMDNCSGWHTDTNTTQGPQSTGPANTHTHSAYTLTHNSNSLQQLLRRVDNILPCHQYCVDR